MVTNFLNFLEVAGVNARTLRRISNESTVRVLDCQRVLSMSLLHTPLDRYEVAVWIELRVNQCGRPWMIMRDAIENIKTDNNGHILLRNPEDKEGIIIANYTV